MPHTRTNRIILYKLNLKGGVFQIPVADLSCDIPGPTIIITGGMDGDEYTAIRAAYELIDYYAEQKFPGRIIILPVVNVPGFYEGKSLNPLDNKFPKYIYPGRKNGSATEQLVDWLVTTFISESSVWIDLHSGAITESLQPFIWAFQTRNHQQNLVTKSVLQSLASNTIIYEKAPFLSRAAKLASRNCAYFIFECGGNGEQKPADIQRMASWVKQTLTVLQTKKSANKRVSYFQKVTMYRAACEGMWLPSIKLTEVKKGEIGGVLQTLDTKESQRITISETGMVLWMKSSLFTKKYDELVVVASQKVSI